MADLIKFQMYLLQLNKTIHAYLIDALIVYNDTHELVNCARWYDDQFLEEVINRDESDITHTIHYTQQTINREYVYKLIKYINVYYSNHYGEENILNWENLSDELIMNRYTYAYVRQNISFLEFKQMLKHDLPFINCINKENIYVSLNLGRIPEVTVNKYLSKNLAYVILILFMIFVNYVNYNWKMVSK